VKQAGNLSAEIWRATMNQSEGQPVRTPRPDPVTPIAASILQELDLDQPEDRTEAHRRLDAWCGLIAPDDASTPHGPLAN
jgi:hypothetical protein